LEKKIIGIDVDNVITETDSIIRDLIKQKIGVSASEEDIIEWSYSVSCGISKREEEKIFNIFHTFYLNYVELKRGANEGIKELSKHYSIWLITQRPKKTKRSTIAWLKSNGIIYDKIVFTKNKRIYFTFLEYLIEDNGNTACDFANLGKNVFLLNFPWNKVFNHKRIIRVDNWHEIISLLT
jgi:uncharacterized protein